MKKTILFLFILMAFTMVVSAQTTPLFSIFNYTSAGIFENELDAAVSVGEDFTNLDASYLFSGLGNMGFLPTWSTATYNGSGNLLWGGFYKAGDKPWSAFAGLTATDSSGNKKGGTTNTEATVTIASATYSYNSSETETKYTANRLFDDFDFQGQYLFMLGDINTGIGVGVSIDESDTDQTKNIEKTSDFFYDGSATPGTTPPVATKDYTYKNVQSSNNTLGSKGNSANYWIAVPFFIMDGDISQEAGAKISFNFVDNSSSQKEDYSAPADAAATFTNVDNETINKNTTIGIDGFYKKEMPGIWGSNEDNRFYFEAGADFGIEIPKYSLSNSSQATIYAGGGAAGTLSTATDMTIETTGKPGLDFGVYGEVGHKFLYNPGPMVKYGFEPSVGLGVDVDNEFLTDSMTTVTKTDGNNDGDFTDAVDTISTSTTEYENNGSGTGDDETVIDITTTFTLPVSAIITPENWIFSVILGSRNTVELVNKITSTKSVISSTEASSISGTGVAGVPVTTEAGTSEETSVVDTAITIETSNTIGLSMPIGDYAKLDMLLNSNNLLNFDSLVIQATIALP